MTASRALAIRLGLAGFIGAAFLLAAWLTFSRLSPPPEASPIRCITPSEVPAGSPLFLAWEGGGPPFHVGLVDGRGDTLWESGRLSQPLVEVPPEAAAGLPIEEPLAYRVDGFDRRGRAFRAPGCPLTLVRAR